MDQPTPSSNPSPDNKPDVRAQRKPGAAARGNPAEPAASGEGADRLTVLAHELGNLLDGSLRSLSLAKRSLPDAGESDGAATDDGRKRLDIVQQSLLRMAEIVDAAMRQPGPRGSVLPLPATSIELGEAIFHAVDVLTPLATAQGVTISTVVSNGLSGLPTGTLYSAIVNGLTNAIEAVAAADGDGGCVEISAGWTEEGKIRITIQDDGCGLPNAPTDTLFRFGYSTKARGSGLGLSVTRTIVDELPAGTLRLFNRTDRGDTERPGAVFEITYRPCASGNASDAAGAA
ncbi:MAG: HAMP domain-containing sensor histidine kinase [Planctomycetota bacterium]|nr:HAMP domain-containing sensor histidine kinase [Planctomycetota bacterium]